MLSKFFKQKKKTKNLFIFFRLYGSYEALKGGITSEALEDLTGGLTEFFKVKEIKKDLLQIIKRGFEAGSLFGCSIDADPNKFEACLNNGLVRGHAYSITAIRFIATEQGQIPLLRIRNPWGNEQVSYFFN